MRADRRWFYEMVQALGETAGSDLSASEVAARIHRALMIAEAEKYATPGTLFTFTFTGVTEAELEEVRRYLTPFENRIVELEIG